jgi:hypothetical protein
MAIHDEGEGLRILRNVLQATPAVDCNTKLEENWYSSVKIDWDCWNTALFHGKYCHNDSKVPIYYWCHNRVMFIIHVYGSVGVGLGNTSVYWPDPMRDTAVWCSNPITTTNGWTFYFTIHIYKIPDCSFFQLSNFMLREGWNQISTSGT